MKNRSVLTKQTLKLISVPWCILISLLKYRARFRAYEIDPYTLFHAFKADAAKKKEVEVPK